MNGGQLENRVAIVTGAGSGIGRAVVLAAANEGAAVAAVDINLKSVVETAKLAGSAKVRAYRTDVSSHSDVEGLFARVRTDLGEPDALFNIAGVLRLAKIDVCSDEDFDRTFAVNVRGVWLTCQTFIRARKVAGKPGTIVNIASANVFYVEPESPAYSASKGAVYTLTKCLAFDHAREGIRVNCICPGFIETGMTAVYLTDEVRRKAGSMHAVGRIGQPEEIADAAIYLSGPRASFVHGSAMMVDGGYTIGVDFTA